MRRCVKKVTTRFVFFHFVVKVCDDGMEICRGPFLRKKNAELCFYKI